jgi:hypothetical protein
MAHKRIISLLSAMIVMAFFILVESSPRTKSADLAMQPPDSCALCHVKLSEQVPEGHFKPTLNEVKYCLVCHMLKGTAAAFSWVTHLNHYNLGVVSECWLCHRIDAAGNFRLIGVENSEEIKVTQEVVNRMVPYYQSWAKSEYLGHRHAQQSVTCGLCHGKSFPETRASMEQCLTCHGSYQHLAKLTEDVYPNPHNSHLGEIRCTLCHKAHEQSVLYCNLCHVFDLKVP